MGKKQQRLYGQINPSLYVLIKKSQSYINPPKNENLSSASGMVYLKFVTFAVWIQPPPQNLTLIFLTVSTATASSQQRVRLHRLYTHYTPLRYMWGCRLLADASRPLQYRLFSSRAASALREIEGGYCVPVVSLKLNRQAIVARPAHRGSRGDLK